MASLLRRNVSSLPTWKPLRNAIPSFSSHLHTQTDLLVDSICNCLRQNHNWETLSSKFSDVVLTDTLVEKVLLRLKQNPGDAKHALGFFHWSAKVKEDQTHSLSSYSIAIHLLVKARLLTDARALMESVALKSSRGDFSGSFSVLESLFASYETASSCPLVFDLLVQCYAKLRMIDECLEVCGRISDNGFSLSVISMNTLMHFALKCGRCDVVWRVYESMIEKRVYPNEMSVEILISNLCKEGQLKACVDMLDRIQNKRCNNPLVIVSAHLAFRVLEEGRIESGLSVLKRLLQKNMILDVIGYSLVVYARVKMGDLVSAREVFDEMMRRGFDANSFVYTAFIQGYCEKGEIEEANRVMREIEELDLVAYDQTFNVLIRGCARCGRVRESLQYCEKMIDKGLVPSCSAFNEMVERLSQIQDVKRANEMLTKLMDKGFVPDDGTYSHLIVGYANGGHIDEAFKLYYEMEYRKISPRSRVFRSLILGLCHCGKVKEAERYLSLMKSRSLEPSMDVYEALSSIYDKNGDKMKARRLRNEMDSKGLNLRPCAKNLEG